MNKIRWPLYLCVGILVAVTGFVGEGYGGAPLPEPSVPASSVPVEVHPGPSRPAQLSVPVSALIQEVRLKDVGGVYAGMPRQLFGYGLVVGLERTGDSRQVTFTTQSVVNFLKRFGMEVDATSLQLRNNAAVVVTSTVEPGMKIGHPIDVTVSTIGDARSLGGGVLLQTPLVSVDGEVHAVAQGSLTIGGFNVKTVGSRIRKNHPTTGRIPGGAFIVKNDPVAPAADGVIEVRLYNADYANAVASAKAINAVMGGEFAQAVDAGTVQVTTPAAYAGKEIELIALVERVKIKPEMRAKIVVNERTGTVIIGGDVRILPVAIAHGTLRVQIEQAVAVVQPPPLAPLGAFTVAGRVGRVDVREEPARIVQIRESATIRDLVDALNGIRVTPRDLIAILQALKNSGALIAELEVQ